MEKRYVGKDSFGKKVKGGDVVVDDDGTKLVVVWGGHRWMLEDKDERQYPIFREEQMAEYRLWRKAYQ